MKLTKRGLEKLKTNKYVAVDLGIMSKAMQPFWEFCVTLLPMWLAPNLVTLIGFACSIGSYLLLACFSPTMAEPAPGWVYYSVTALLFAYQTLDAIDGQLFDHGCDVVSTVPVLCTASAMFLSSPVRATVIVFTMMFGFYMATWEEFHTGVMRFDIIGLTEGQMMLFGMIAFTGYAGPEFWVQPFPLIGEMSPFEFTYRDFMAGFLIVGVVGTFFTAVQKVSANRTSGMAMNDAYLQFIPLVIILGSGVVWMTYSPTNTPFEHIRLFLNTLGLTFSHLTCRMIICHATGDDFVIFHYTLAPVLFGAANAFYASTNGGEGIVPEYEWMIFTFSFGVMNLLYFAYMVIDQITTTLGIRTFVITKPSAA